MSLLNKKKDEYLIYHYKVHEIYILFPDENYKVPSERLSMVTVICDYIGNLYPIVKMNLSMEKSLYDRIIKEKDRLQIKLNIRKYYRNNTKEKKSIYEQHINEVFMLILDDTDNQLDFASHKEEFPNGDKDQLNALTTTVELFLFKKSFITSNATLMNRTLKDHKVDQGVGYLLAKGGASNVLMPPIDNQTIYKELKIPPLKIAEALSFLDSYYGLYNTGTIMFFGFDRGYIIPFCRPSNAFSQGEKETVCIIVPRVGGSKLTDTLCSVKKYDDTTKLYVVADPNSFTPRDPSTTDSILTSSELTVIDNDSGDMTVAKDDKKGIAVKRGENVFYTEIYNAVKESNKGTISIAFKDCDFSIFTPNKNYQFLFEDTKMGKQYRGLYSLCSFDVTYAKEAKDLTAGATGVFRRHVK